MRLKGIRTIALLVVATLLLIGSVALIVVRDAEREYWWELTANAEEIAEGIIGEVARVKGMSPEEVRERFDELFGVDLWNMTYWEFVEFLDKIPPRPVCFEELAHNPYIIAVFGEVPELPTEHEIRQFDEKLKMVMDYIRHSGIMVKIRPLFGEGVVPVIGAGQGVIRIAVRCRDLPKAEEIYEIIAEKAEALWGIDDVPVVFSGGIRGGPAGRWPGRCLPAWRRWHWPYFRWCWLLIPGGVRCPT